MHNNRAPDDNDFPHFDISVESQAEADFWHLNRLLQPVYTTLFIEYTVALYTMPFSMQVPLTPITAATVNLSTPRPHLGWRSIMRLLKQIVTTTSERVAVKFSGWHINELSQRFLTTQFVQLLELRNIDFEIKLNHEAGTASSSPYPLIWFLNENAPGTQYEIDNVTLCIHV